MEYNGYLPTRAFCLTSYQMLFSNKWQRSCFMRYMLDRENAFDLLKWANQQNPGPWYNHSIYVENIKTIV
jgi:poly(3-hydroxyalkanoate) synthetase